jgi:hypothetical protein
MFKCNLVDRGREVDELKAGEFVILERYFIFLLEGLSVGGFYFLFLVFKL